MLKNCSRLPITSLLKSITISGSASSCFSYPDDLIYTSPLNKMYINEKHVFSIQSFFFEQTLPQITKFYTSAVPAGAAFGAFLIVTLNPRPVPTCMNPPVYHTVRSFVEAQAVIIVFAIAKTSVQEPSTGNAPAKRSTTTSQSPSIEERGSRKSLSGA